MDILARDLCRGRLSGSGGFRSFRRGTPPCLFLFAYGTFFAHPEIYSISIPGAESGVGAENCSGLNPRPLPSRRRDKPSAPLQAGSEKAFGIERLIWLAGSASAVGAT